MSENFQGAKITWTSYDETTRFEFPKWKPVFLILNGDGNIEDTYVTCAVCGKYHSIYKTCNQP